MRSSAVLLYIFACVACNGGSGEVTDGGSGESTRGSSTGSTTTELPTTGATDTGEPTTAGSTVASTTAVTSSTGPDDATTGDATTGDATTGDETTGGPVEPVYDPDEDGPWQYDQVEGVIAVGSADVPVIAYYPTTGPTAGPYPVVTLAHGFNLPPSQYIKYATRLASHGYVALNVDHRGYLGQAVDHVANAEQVLAALDWAAGHPVLMDISDVDNVGATGHSLGGKISVLAAISDARVKASITLDPVDGATMCPNMMACPDVSAMLPIEKPLGFLGETLDAAGFMACAPADDNFTTFFAEAAAPALQVTVEGANHMSFIDDVASCGFICAFCQPAELDNATVNGLARAYVVAFYGRHLRKNPGYDTYLIGAEAQARYVDTGLVAIQSK